MIWTWACEVSVVNSVNPSINKKMLIGFLDGFDWNMWQFTTFKNDIQG